MSLQQAWVQRTSCWFWHHISIVAVRGSGVDIYWGIEYGCLCYCLDCGDLSLTDRSRCKSSHVTIKQSPKWTLNYSHQATWPLDFVWGSWLVGSPMTATPTLRVPSFDFDLEWHESIGVLLDNQVQIIRVPPKRSSAEGCLNILVRVWVCLIVRRRPNTCRRILEDCLGLRLRHWVHYFRPSHG